VRADADEFLTEDDKPIAAEQLLAAGLSIA
jgi:hypothetical protein